MRTAGIEHLSAVFPREARGSTVRHQHTGADPTHHPYEGRA